MSNGNGGVAGGTARVAAAAAAPRPAPAGYLLARGFEEDTIASAGWRVEPLGDRCRRYGLPADASSVLAWFIPYRHPNGKVAFERIRLIDPAELERYGGGKYRQPADWSRSAGERGLALYDPFCALEADGPVDAIILIEGEANAVTLYQLGIGSSVMPVIGLPGQGALSAGMARQLGHVPVVLVWIDRADPGADRNAERIAERLGLAGVEDVRFVGDTANMDANDVLRTFGADEARTLVSEQLERARPLDRSGPPRSTVPGWPEPLLPAALHGLAGDVVRAIEPHSESDPAALLVQFLVAFGSAVGRGAGFSAEADHHGVNLYAVIVGATAGGRKGSSWGQIRRLLGLADEPWAKDRVQSGVTSGEGLIWAVRDPVYKATKKRRDDEGSQEELTDAGITDKRLLALEAEFASVLKVASRDGSTVSTTLRKAWDGGDHLQVMTKNNPARATEAHVSLIGHITDIELRRELTSTDRGNGFANRFLYVCARRSKLLPEGGSLRESDREALAERVREALRHAGVTERMRRDADARALWAEVYGGLAEGRPGLVGSITSRAEPQVMRLACVYALLDLSGVVRRDHLEAGLAVWKYCEASVRYVFGDSLGDPFADEILAAIRSAPRGLTGTELRDRFHRHKSAAEFGRALDVISEAGLAVCTSEPTGGAPRKRWVAR